MTEEVNEPKEEKRDVPKGIVIEGRTIKTRLTIEDAINANFKLSDFISGADKRVDISWQTLLKLCNKAIIEGEPLTRKSLLSEAIPIITQVMKSAFLGS